MSATRLGLAVSGQIGKWEALSKLSGISAGLTAGAIIDWVNEQHYGSDLYDLLHPDANTNTNWRNAITPPRRDQSTELKLTPCTRMTDEA